MRFSFQTGQNVIPAIFWRSLDSNNVIAMQDPVYPVYVDTSVMAGRTGEYLANGYYDRLVYLPCNAENGFIPEIPEKKVDIVFLCYPNNPTGTTASKTGVKKMGRLCN